MLAIYEMDILIEGIVSRDFDIDFLLKNTHLAVDNSLNIFLQTTRTSARFSQFYVAAGYS